MPRTRLEDRGFVDTETVPSDIRRQRLRMVLANMTFREAGAAELATTDQAVLGNNAIH